MWPMSRKKFYELKAQADEILKNLTDCKGEIKDSIISISNSFFEDPPALFTFTINGESSFDLAVSRINLYKPLLVEIVKGIDNKFVDQVMFALSKVQFTCLNIIAHHNYDSEPKVDKTLISCINGQDEQYINV